MLREEIISIEARDYEFFLKFSEKKEDPLNAQMTEKEFYDSFEAETGWKKEIF